MKTSVFKPVILLALFVLVVGTACLFSGGGKATQEPIVVVVTATPESPAVETVAPQPPTAAPTEEAAQSGEPDDYFVEEFDSGLDNYSYFVKSGDESQADVYSEDGELKFKLNGYDIYYYVLYDPYTYGDVRLDMEVENQGNNNNAVSLVCRYSEDLGWYEFNISSGGLWEIDYFDRIVAKGYTRLSNGGSTNVKMGRDSNVYTAICQGNTLSLYINGTLTKSIEHKDLDRGLVGVGINSFDSYPVLMNIPWMEISEP
jgi:hypothetical protein